CTCLATPWLVYYLDNRQMLDSRTQDKIIFTNPQRMVDQFHINHDPLYVGLRMPTPEDIYPVLPVAFEKTPLSVQLPGLCYEAQRYLPCQDGFWLRALWNQTTATLSILTYRYDASSVYTFTMGPIAKPVEAVLIIFGIAWAA